MKRFFANIATLATALLFAVGCYPDVIEPDQGKLPSASDFDVEITVDQTTNYVTFTMKNQGMVPMWIFGNETIDKTPNSRYAYTRNGLCLRFRDEGEHTVEVKAYNANGISLGSQIYKFNIESTYRDPFDATPYMKALAGEWVWNSAVNAHFGCGSSLANALDWWTCGANEKADWSLYNDTMTFTEDGKYFFDPGEDGKVYVNAGVLALGGPQDADFLVDIPAYESTYSIENEWNESGIEEIWLVLPAQKNLSYIPNDDIYNDPRFLFLESKPSQIRKELLLNSAFHGISWHYDFIHPVQVAGPEELLAGTSAAGKAWVMDADAPGHLGCGPNVDDPASWWSASPNEKAGFGMYDNVLTFFPDGTYKFDSGEDGKIYVNKEVELFGITGAGEDYMVDFANKECPYSFDGSTLVLEPENTIGYVPNEQAYTNPVFVVKEVTDTRLVLVSNKDGIAWQFIFKARDGQEAVLTPEQLLAGTGAGKVWVMDSEVKGHLGCGWDADNAAGWWAADPNDKAGFGVYDNELTFCPDGTFKFSSGPDGKIYVNKEVTVLGVTGASEDYDIEFADRQCSYDFDGETITLEAHNTIGYLSSEAAWEEPVFIVKELTATRLVLATFHHTTGNPDGIAWQYIFKARDAQAGGDEPSASVEWVDESSADNLVNAGTLSVFGTYWVVGEQWTPVAAPTVDVAGKKATVTVSEGCGSQSWQGQIHLSTGVALEQGKKYDFRVVLNPTEDLNNACVKPHPEGDDGNFFSDARHTLISYDENVITYENYEAAVDYSNLIITFDFPNCPAGAVIEIDGIIVQEHK